MNLQLQPAMQLRRHCLSSCKNAGQLLLLLLALFLTTTTFAQEAKTVKLKGFVVDQKGDPLSGVSVQAANGSTTVTTGADGSFEITAPEGGQLTISYVGYISQQIKVGNKNQLTLRVQLQTKKDLDEVVVVGYGTRRKSEVTGSMVSVNEQSIKDVPTSNVLQALQGRAAGVDIQKVNGNSKPGSDVSIMIRGVRSVEASNAPLIVVDGIPYGGNFNDLNQDDITSIEILKDASATAIYGSRGANGVLLISTRRGKSGKAVVSYSGYVGSNRRIGEINMMNASEFFEFRKWSRLNGSYSNGVPTYTGIDDPKLVSDNFSAADLQLLAEGRSWNWQDLIYKHGKVTNHDLNVSGGNEQTQYAISGGYFNETGSYPGQSFERGTVKISVDHVISKMFKVGLSSLNNYSVRKGESFNPMAQAIRASPLVGPYTADGTLLNDWVPGSNSQVWNPLADFLPGAQVENRRRLGTFSTLYLEANLGKWLPGLKYRFNAGAEIRNVQIGSYYTSKGSVNKGGPSTSRTRTENSTNYTLENILSYDKTIAERHKINFTGLFSVQEDRSSNNTLTMRNIMADEMEYTNPEFASDPVPTGGQSNWGLLSYMGRLNYGFDDRYLLTLTVRTDGSSRLSEGEQYKVFPSAAVAWNIHNEKFFKVNAINNLRFRASYGRVGNASVSAYGTLASLNSVVYNYGETNVRGAYLGAVANPSLVWEYTSTLEFGLDFGLFNNRISGTLNVYKQITDDLLLQRRLPLTTGIEDAVLTNVGQTQNKGIELQLSTVNIPAKSRDAFSWSTDFSFAINRGKINKLVDGILEDRSNGWFVGHPIGAMFGYEGNGVWQANKADTAEAKRLNLTTTGATSVIGEIRVKDRNGNNRIDADDQYIFGSTQPDWTGGMTNRFTYKGFDLAVVAFSRWGGTLISTVHSGGFANTYQGNYNNIRTRYWTPTNGENFYPKPNSALTNANNRSIIARYDASFVKIRTISLGYGLGPNLLKKMGLKRLRIYAQVEDPFILFSPYTRDIYGGLDPEAGGDASNPADNADIDVDTPPMRSFILGLNISF